MISFNNLGISNHGHKLIKALSFSLYPGALVNIHGGNGTGKTTMLRAIAGLTSFDEGFIATAFEEEEQVGVRYLAHKNCLKPYLSVIDNISFWAELTDTEELVPVALNFLGLEELATRKCKTLSQGQQKLVALARLIVSPAKIWLLDEPFSNLDDDNKVKIQQLISGKTHDGGITIVTSHSKITFLDMLNINLKDFKTNT